MRLAERQGNGYFIKNISALIKPQVRCHSMFESDLMDGYPGTVADDINYSLFNVRLFPDFVFLR